MNDIPWGEIINIVLQIIQGCSARDRAEQSRRPGPIAKAILRIAIRRSSTPRDLRDEVFQEAWDVLQAMGEEERQALAEQKPLAG